MSSIQEKQQVLIDDFDFIEEWMDKYNHIIEMGKSMTTLSEEEKEEDEDEDCLLYTSPSPRD